jgi:ribosome-binding factor A
VENAYVISRRQEKVASFIRHEIAEMILRELNDPRLTGLVSVTRVKVSSDLSSADVFITSMGTPGQQNAALLALQSASGIMRTKLTHTMNLRVAPFLKFHIDEALKKEIAVLELIRKANEEREAVGGQPAAEERVEERIEEPVEERIEESRGEGPGKPQE